MFVKKLKGVLKKRVSKTLVKNGLSLILSMRRDGLMQDGNPKRGPGHNFFHGYYNMDKCSRSHEEG